MDQDKSKLLETEIQSQILSPSLASYLPLVVLGIVSDLMTIFGSFVQVGLIIFLGLIAISLIQKNLIIKYGSRIGFLIFLFFFSAQLLDGAEDKGFLAKHFEIALQIQQRLTSIDKKLDGLQKDITKIHGDEITIISPRTNAKVTSNYNKNHESECLTLYDQGDRFYQALDHKNSAENIERMLSEEKFTNAELAEYHCRLGFRISHINHEQAIKHYKHALMLEPDNIGALLGMAILNPGSTELYIEKAYAVAENRKNLNAFPYIITVDYTLEIPKVRLGISDEAAIGLIESGLEVSKKLNIQRMVDRFQEFRIENQVRKSNSDRNQMKLLLQESFPDCNSRTSYIDQVRCHYFRGALLFTYLKDGSGAINELNEAINIAKRKNDLRTELYLEIELLNLVKYDLTWREDEKRLQDLLKKAEALGNWDILQLIWNNLAGVASFRRQNPKLALERMEKSIEYLEKSLGDDSIVKKSLLLIYLPQLANYAARANNKKIHIEALERIVNISEEIGSKFIQLFTQAKYISAVASSLGWQFGEPFSLEVENKLATNLRKFGELDNLFMKSIIKHDISFFGVDRPMETYQQYKKNDTFYCIDKFGQEITPYQEYNCLKEHAFDTIIMRLGINEHLLVLNNQASENIYYHLMHTVEKMLIVRKRLSGLQDLSFSYLVTNPAYEWQKEINNINEKSEKEGSFELLMRLEQATEKDLDRYSKSEISDLIKFAINSNRKEAAEKILVNLENYWRSGKAEGYKWSNILSNLIKGYHYLENPEKELSYLCTAYVQSYLDDAGDSWFDMWRRPYTMIEIMRANNKIIVNKLSNKYIQSNNLLEEYIRLCLIELSEKDGSGEAKSCRETLPAIFAQKDISFNFDEEILNIKNNLSQLKEKIDLKFCEEFRVEQFN